jgi:hypothetical protein
LPWLGLILPVHGLIKKLTKVGTHIMHFYQRDFYFFLVEKFLSSFPNQYLDLGFDMLEEDLIVRGQNIINHFSEIFVESVLKKINKGNVKTNLS